MAWGDENKYNKEKNRQIIYYDSQMGFDRTLPNTLIIKCGIVKKTHNLLFRVLG